MISSPLTTIAVTTNADLLVPHSPPLPLILPTRHFPRVVVGWQTEVYATFEIQS